MVGRPDRDAPLLTLRSSSEKVSRLDLYFWSKVRSHDISCTWRTARTPSRGPSQASRGASIVLTQKECDEVTSVGQWLARVGTRLKIRYTVIGAVAGLVWSQALGEDAYNCSECFWWRRVVGV